MKTRRSASHFLPIEEISPALNLADCWRYPGNNPFRYRNPVHRKGKKLMFRFRLVAFLLLALCLFVVAESHADSGRGRHQKFYAVPAPGKVAIDGKLND